MPHKELGVLHVWAGTMGVLHRIIGVLHRVRGVLHRILGVPHRVLGVLYRVLGVVKEGETGVKNSTRIPDLHMPSSPSSTPADQGTCTSER